MPIEIKHRLNKGVLRVVEAESLQGVNLQGVNLQAAYLYRAYLEGVNLRGANLYRADLQGAYLEGAKLEGAKNITLIGPVGQERRIVYAVRHDPCLMVKAGRFWGTVDELEQRVKEKYEGTKWEDEYLDAIKWLRIWDKTERQVKNA